jgi:Sec-independent protein secretion pathway component TatC
MVCAILGKVFIAINLTGLKNLRLFEGLSVSVKIALIFGIKISYPIRD